MWGGTESMKQYRLGKKIKPYKGNLPKNINSDNQREAIYKLVLKKINR